MKIIMALLVFSVIVLVHEFGHFLLAKKNGIEVTEFSIGFGPRLFSFIKNGTRYSLKILPFGGSCLMLGDDSESDEQNAFCNKSVWARISVIVAGPVFNFILAFAFAMIITSFIGFDRPVIYDVMEDYPAAAAGVQPGDEVVKMNGEKIHLFREISIFMQIHKGESIDLTYKRDGKLYNTKIEPKQNEDGSYLMGINQNPNPRQKGNGLETLKYSLYEIKFQISTTIKSVGMLFQGKVSADDVAGPVRMVSLIGDTYEQSKEDGTLYVILNLLNMCILLSTSLGVMNLLPLPALDGGRLVFLIIELIRGKAIPPEKEGMVHAVGMILLMMLMVFILGNDIRLVFFK